MSDLDRELRDDEGKLSDLEHEESAFEGFYAPSIHTVCAFTKA